MASKSNIFLLYLHRNKANNKVYIGITSAENPNDRWRDGRGYKGSPHFYSAIQKYGWDNFEHIVLKTGLTESEAKQAEISLIAEYDSTNQERGYNITLGGEGSYKGKNSKSKEYRIEWQRRYRAEHPEKREIKNKKRRENRNKDPKYREEQKARYRKRREDPEYLEWHRKTTRENNKKFFAEHPDYRKERRKRLLEDPEYEKWYREMTRENARKQRAKKRAANTTTATEKFNR